MTMSVWSATFPAPARRGVRVMPGAFFDTLVVGAGLTGVVTALLLAQAGLKVALVDALWPGACGNLNTMGGTTSVLQGGNLSRLRRHQGDTWLRFYLAGHRAAQTWLGAELTTAGIEHQRRTAYTYATTADGIRTLEREAAAARMAGLEVSWGVDPGLPFPVAAAIAVRDAIQFHPIQVLTGLLDRTASKRQWPWEAGGSILTHDHTWPRGRCLQGVCVSPVPRQWPGGGLCPPGAGSAVSSRWAGYYTPHARSETSRWRGPAR